MPLLFKASTVGTLSISARQTKMLHLEGTHLHHSITYRLLKSFFDNQKFFTDATENFAGPLAAQTHLSGPSDKDTGPKAEINSCQF
ncbi:hypothetical protein Hanom_Chr06g00497771 [Helianthus anomalus]